MKRMIWAVFFLLLFNAAASAATVLIEPAVTTTSIGGTVSLDVEVTNVTGLYAYQFDLSFDPAVLSATAITEGPFLAGGGSTFFFPGAIDNLLATLTLTAGSLEGPVPGVSGSGTLATLLFDVIGFGTSSVNLSNVALINAAGAEIAITPSRNGSVTSPVPEPASVWLLAGGVLGGLVARAYRGSFHRA